jgi:hypothetical protein
MFESRNLLFQHLREERHTVVNDDENGELDSDDMSREAASHPPDEAGASSPNMSSRVTPGAQVSSCLD